jgi:hypothetical protein
MSKQSKLFPGFNLNKLTYDRGPKDVDPVDSDIPDAWEATEQITESDIVRQIRNRNDAPPRILTNFQQRVMAVYPQPSDKIYMNTWSLVGGAQPVQIVNETLAGVACQITILQYGDGAGAGDVLIASRMELLVPTTGGGYQNNAIRFEGPAVGTQAIPFVISTRAQLWAICVDAVTAHIGVMIEVYEPDAYTWEPWEAGAQG